MNGCRPWKRTPIPTPGTSGQGYFLCLGYTGHWILAKKQCADLHSHLLQDFLLDAYSIGCSWHELCCKGKGEGNLRKPPRSMEKPSLCYSPSLFPVRSWSYWSYIDLCLFPSVPVEQGQEEDMEIEAEELDQANCLLQREEEKKEGAVAFQVYRAYWLAVGSCLALSILFSLLLMQGKAAARSTLSLGHPPFLVPCSASQVCEESMEVAGWVYSCFIPPAGGRPIPPGLPA